MTEQLLRIDATAVKEGVYKLLYTVPAGYQFVVSGMYTKSADTLKLKINNIEYGEAHPDGSTTSFFNKLVLNSEESIYVTTARSWGLDNVCMNGSLVQMSLPN